MNHVTKVMGVSIVVNVILSILKMIIGFLGSSTSLLADGIHSLSDLATDFFAIIGNKIASKPADVEHPYGHGKIEYITSLVIGIVILMVGGSVIYGSFGHSISVPSTLVIVVSMFTIVTKYMLAEFIIRKGKEYRNTILTASGTESKMDVLSSVVVLISSILMQFSNTYPVLKYSDKLATIIVGIFIMSVGYGVLKENLSTVLGKQEMDQKMRMEIEKIISSYEEIYHTESLRILKYGASCCMDAVIHMDGGLTIFYAHQIVDKLEEQIRERYPSIQYFNIHMEPEEIDCKLQ